MKKIILFTILLLVVFGSLSCNNKKEDEYIAFMISDSIESYVDKQEPIEQVIETNFGVLNVQYIETIKNNYNYVGEVKAFETIINEKNYRIVVDSNNKIVSLSLRDKLEHSNETTEISKEEAVEITKEYLNKYDIDINDYTISSYLDSIYSGDWYIIVYEKQKYNNYSNGDQIRFQIDLYGNVKYFSASFFGLIPIDAGQKFDQEKVASCALDFAYNRYQVYKGGYELSFEIDEMRIICLDDNKYAVQASVYTRFKQDDNPFEHKYLDYIIVKTN